MDINIIIAQIKTICKVSNVSVTQIKHEEDDDFYQVWKIECDNKKYLLKEGKGDEAMIYSSIFAEITDGAPKLCEILQYDEKSYILMEYFEGENLSKCDRTRLTQALNALISLQRKTWGNTALPEAKDSYNKGLTHRKKRGEYLNNRILEDAYTDFLSLFESLPVALCHDDLLPFNIIATEDSACLIDWEAWGILPYPTSFARLIAHCEDDKSAFFYMSEDDRQFAIEYYHKELLSDKGITYDEWLRTLDYFLLYEYCEWVYVGNKYGATDGEYYKKYFPIAINQAKKLLNV